MSPQDLIFYLHPIYNAYSKNEAMDAIDFLSSASKEQ